MANKLKTLKQRNEQPTSDSYLIHKVGKQFVASGLESASTAYRTAVEYQIYTSRYSANPQEDIFQNYGQAIYQPTNLLGQFFRRFFLPESFRRDRLSEEQIKDLRENYAPKLTTKQITLLKASNVVQIAANAGAIAYCMAGDQKCSTQEYATFGFNGLSSGLFYVGGHFHGRGGSIVGQRQILTDPMERQRIGLRAFGNLNAARQIFIFMNLAEIAAGITKMGIEFRNAVKNPDAFSLSAMIHGGAEIGRGSSWLVLNSYYAREATRFAKSSATLDKGIDILWVHAINVPPKILWAARGFGMIGPAISGAISAQDVYQGITDENLDPDKNRHKIISGSLGISSSLFFGGFAFFMTPATVPLGTACFTTGLGLMAGQTIYDEWEPLTNFFKEKIDTMENYFNQLQNVSKRMRSFSGILHV